MSNTPQNAAYGDRIYTQDSYRVLPSIARTASINSAIYQGVNSNRLQAKGIHLVTDITVLTAGADLTVTIEAFEGVTALVYTPQLIGASLLAVGTYTLKIYPGILAVPNVSANDFLPDLWRVTVTVANANSVTYSIVARLIT